jgi:hypothetical protein
MLSMKWICIVAREASMKASCAGVTEGLYFPIAPLACCARPLDVILQTNRVEVRARIVSKSPVWSADRCIIAKTKLVLFH